jgi:hypothetical protein
LSLSPSLESYLQKRESWSYKLALLPSQLAQWVWQRAGSSGSTAQPTSSAAVVPDLESSKDKLYIKANQLQDCDTCSKNVMSATMQLYVLPHSIHLLHKKVSPAHAMKAYGGAKVQFSSFLTSVLDGDECLAFMHWPLYHQERTLTALEYETGSAPELVRRFYRREKGPEACRLEPRMRQPMDHSLHRLCYPTSQYCIYININILVLLVCGTM